MHVWFFAFLFIIFSSMWGFFSLFALYTWLYYTQYHQSLISAVQHYIIMSDIATFLGCVCLCIVLPQSDIHSTRSVGYRKNFLLLLIFFSYIHTSTILLSFQARGFIVWICTNNRRILNDSCSKRMSFWHQINGLN